MASFTEPFNGTGALPAGWNTLAGAASCVSGAYQASSVPSASFYSSFTPTNDQEISVVIGNLANLIDIYARFNTTSFNGYFANINADGSTRIQKITGGTPTSLAFNATGTWTTGDTATFRLSGSTLSVLRNGTSVLSISDSSYTSGIGGCGTDSTADAINTFTAADYSTGVTGAGGCVGVAIATATAVLLAVGSAVGVASCTAAPQLLAGAVALGVANGAATAVMQGASTATGVASATSGAQLLGSANATGVTTAAASADLIGAGAAVGIGIASAAPLGASASATGVAIASASAVEVGSGAAGGVATTTAAPAILSSGAAIGTATSSATPTLLGSATAAGVATAGATATEAAAASGTGVAIASASAQIIGHGSAVGVGVATATPPSGALASGTGIAIATATPILCGSGAAIGEATATATPTDTVAGHAYYLTVLQRTHYRISSTASARYQLTSTSSPDSQMDTLAPVDTVVRVNVVDQFDPDGDVPVIGRNDVVVFYSDDDTTDAAPIDDTLKQTASDTGTPGTYVAEFLGSDLLNFLPQRVGQTIYRVEQMGTHAIKITPLLVVASL